MAVVARKTENDNLARIEELAKVAANDTRALNELLTRIRPILIDFVAHKGLDRSGEAEDVVQEALLRISCHIKSFDASRAKFSTWARTILFRLMLNEQRNENRRRGLYGKYQADSEVHRYFKVKNDRPDKIMEVIQLEDAIESALDEIPETFRQVMLPLMQGERYEEISEQTGLKLGTVKSRVNRGRAFVSKHIEKHRS